MKTEERMYPKWVGLVLGIVLSGSAHFLSGRRSVGVAWCIGILLCPIAGILVLVIPGVASWVVGLGLMAAFFVLWVVMVLQSYRPVRQIGIAGWGAIIVIAITLNVAERATMFSMARGYQVPPTAMSPTIASGDRIMTEKISYRLREPRRGEIVVYMLFKRQGIPGVEEDRTFVRRIVGLPGERISVKPPYMMVDGKPLMEPGVFKGITYVLADKMHGEKAMSDPAREIVLGPNEYFVVGDNSTQSLDSRYWGALPRKNIVGRATRIWWPMGRIGETLD